MTKNFGFLRLLSGAGLTGRLCAFLFSAEKDDVDATEEFGVPCPVLVKEVLKAGLEGMLGDNGGP